MSVDTVSDIAEELADKMNIYEVCDDPYEGVCHGKCRACWTSNMMSRMRDAVHDEDALALGRQMRGEQHQ